jgi:hypothetical protein
MSTAVGSCSSRSRTTASFWLAQKLQGMCVCVVVVVVVVMSGGDGGVAVWRNTTTTQEAVNLSVVHIR